MIYTCYDMVRDCRAGKPEGWSYFLTNYVPLVRKLLAHYFPHRAGDARLLEVVLQALCRSDSSLFAAAEPAPERIFAAELRQRVLAAIDEESRDVPAAIELETVMQALAPLTMVEHQAVWFETMRYTAADVGRMMRMDPATVEKIRARGAELVRASVDAWSRSLLADSGIGLGKAAAAAGPGADCLNPKAFLDVIDGRTTWQGREQMEGHVGACAYCLDHFCRMLEAVDQMRGIAPLSEGEAAPFRQLLGVTEPKKASGWKKLFGAR